MTSLLEFGSTRLISSRRSLDSSRINKVQDSSVCPSDVESSCSSCPKSRLDSSLLFDWSTHPFPSPIVCDSLFCHGLNPRKDCRFPISLSWNYASDLRFRLAILACRPLVSGGGRIHRRTSQHHSKMFALRSANLGSLANRGKERNDGQEGRPNAEFSGFKRWTKQLVSASKG